VPGVDCGAYRALTQPVCQVGGGGGCDARAEELACRGQHALVAPVSVESRHAGRQDETVDSERDEAGGHAGFTVVLTSS